MEKKEKQQPFKALSKICLNNWHYIDRKTHEIISAEIFMKDEKVKQWFTEEQINTIKEAIYVKNNPIKSR